MLVESVVGRDRLTCKLQAVLESAWFQNTILVLIVLNAVTLGLETSPRVMAMAGDPILIFDKLVLGIFVAELLARIFVYRGRFFRDYWSLFDFAVVSIALLPATGQFAVLRALRVLRVLRILTMVPSMRKVVGALVGAIPGLSSIALVLLLVYYVFAVIATNLFAVDHPEFFGSLGDSLYTLFQIMTLESWSMGIARPVMETHPFAWAFFVPFILVATFTMLNLFIAIIVNAMQTFSEGEAKETREALKQAQSHIEADLHGEVKMLRLEIAELKEMLHNRV
jgi:voltage-gated sodium channel